MKYCTKCVMPDTRPGLTFNKEGVCSACIGAEEKRHDIDWKAREAELKQIFKKFKGRGDWDCIVPVSGGKDSIYQVHVVKNEYKLKPLATTFRTEARTPLGEHNIQALKTMGVDHVEFTPNPKAFSKLRLKTFLEEGDCSIPDHLAIWGIIPNLALRFNVPLVIWGENPDMEYGGEADLRKVARLNRDWMKNQNILKGKTLSDWGASDNLKMLEMPAAASLDKLDYTPIFLGYYLPWDARHNFKVAQSHGFKARKEPVMGLYEYADVDCMYIVIHHYFKWLKFGFNRVTDNACNEIRKGRMTREEAIKLIREKDGIKPPKSYILHFCKSVGITEAKFWEVAERFRNQEIWKKDENGEWYIQGWIAGDKLPDRFPFQSEM